MAQNASEQFFGIELSNKVKEFEWNGPDETEDDVETKLQILQACLGANAKDGERNIVDVTVTDADGEEATHTILSMARGQTEMARMDLGFVEKVKFKLAKGNGPVHLCGSLLRAYSPFSDDDEDESDDEDIPELVMPKKKADADEKPGIKDEKKQPQVGKKDVSELTNKPGVKKYSIMADEAGKKSKDQKANVEEDEDETSEEDDEDEAILKGKGLLDDEASEDEEDDDEDMSDEGDELDSDEELDEDDDEDDDDDDDDDEDISDEDEESEEEEKLEPPKAKKPKVVANGHKDDKGKSPGKKQEAKKVETPKNQPVANSKTPKSADKKTPKGEKKDGKDAKTPKSAPSIDEVKTKLLKSPNLPKTAEKFKNFMKNAHKLTDEKEVQGIWEWLQKNKK